MGIGEDEEREEEGDASPPSSAPSMATAASVKPSRSEPESPMKMRAG